MRFGVAPKILLEGPILGFEQAFGWGFRHRVLAVNFDRHY